METNDWIGKLKRIEATEGRHVYLTSNWLARGDKTQYQSLVVFMPRGSTAEDPALAGFVYDTDYLSTKFFPQALNDVLPNQNKNDTWHQPVMMVRTANLWLRRFVGMEVRLKWSAVLTVCSPD
jgi:hypothetical protein